MSLAPSVAVTRAQFNWLPLLIALFCLIWSFAFVAGKIGVTDCPPLILLSARFLLAGLIISGISALRRERFDLSLRDVAVFALLGVANNALYLGLGYTGLKTVSAGIGGLVVCGATAASAYHFLMPPLGMLFAFLVLGEHVELRDLLGIVPVALGIYLVTRPAAPALQRS